MNKKEPKRFPISKKGLREFLQDPHWVKSEELTKKMEAIKLLNIIYTNTDGRVLDVFFPEKRGVIYESLEDFLTWIQILEDIGKQPNQHILEGRLPQGKDFPEHVPQLIDELATLLKIPRSELDGKAISLQKVDPKVKRLGKQKCLEVPIFPALVAYVGEVMRLETGGKWDMRLDKHDGKTWEPWILDPQGRSVPPFIDLFDMFTEGPIAIYASTIVRIAQRRVLPPPGPPHREAMSIIFRKKPDNPSA
jgi:hypothetical protein